MTNTTERNSAMAKAAEREIRDIMMRINQAWLHGHVEDMPQYFDENVLVLPPGVRARVRGRDACVQSYQEFVRNAHVRDYVEHEFTVDVFGNTAIATYRFDITYDMKGKSYTDTGIDLFVFNRDTTGWKAVCRTMLPLHEG